MSKRTKKSVFCSTGTSRYRACFMFAEGVTKEISNGLCGDFPPLLSGFSLFLMCFSTPIIFNGFLYS